MSPSTFSVSNIQHLRGLRGLALSALIAVQAACGGGGGGDTGGGGSGGLPSVDTSAVAVGNTASALPPDWHQGVFAQIFVRSYQDSDGDGIGDLAGLTQRLDHLRDLGVTGLWLMPVTRSQDGDHGYAVTDYRAIERDYGRLADLDELLKQAHARGIGVIIDHVVNHSAAENALFVQSRSSTANAYRDWYVWRGSAPSGWSIYGQNPWRSTDNGAYFAAFWDQMPEFDLRQEPVLQYHENALRFWLNRGVDGFRFDAVGNLVENGPNAWENQPQNVQVMARLRRVVQGYQQRFMVCESPGAPQVYAADTACGASFAFGLQGQMMAAARGDTAAIAEVAGYFTTAPAGMATLLSNHDSFAGDRVWDQLGGDPAQMRLAAATYLLLPGTPFVYYGEEIGMSGARSLSGDPRLRTPMSWTSDATHAGFSTRAPYRALADNARTQNVAAQAGRADSLLAHYRGLIALRLSRDSLRRGAYEAPRAAGRTLSFQRRAGGERTLVLFNYGTSTATVRADGLPAGTTLARLWPAGEADASTSATGAVSLSLPRQSVAVFAVP